MRNSFDPRAGTAVKSTSLADYLWLGRRDFDWASDLQRKTWQARAGEAIRNRVLFLEHPPVITLGRTGDPAHLLVTEDQLTGLGSQLRYPDRGGDVTFHGPGQLVCYPIIDLGEPFPDLHKYLRDLEEVIIATLTHFGVRSRRVTGATGVWTSKGKIAAIGVKVARGVTMHGFSLNVGVDLGWYRHIVPCGLEGKKVTSLDRLVGRSVELVDVAEVAAASFDRVFAGRRR